MVERVKFVHRHNGAWDSKKTRKAQGVVTPIGAVVTAATRVKKF